MRPLFAQKNRGNPWTRLLCSLVALVLTIGILSTPSVAAAKQNKSKKGRCRWPLRHQHRLLPGPLRQDQAAEGQGAKEIQALYRQGQVEGRALARGSHRLLLIEEGRREGAPLTAQEVQGELYNKDLQARKGACQGGGFKGRGEEDGVQPFQNGLSAHGGTRPYRVRELPRTRDLQGDSDQMRGVPQHGRTRPRLGKTTQPHLHRGPVRPVPPDGHLDLGAYGPRRGYRPVLELP